VSKTGFIKDAEKESKKRGIEALPYKQEKRKTEA
jgi:hypothetical protein